MSPEIKNIIPFVLMVAFGTGMEHTNNIERSQIYLADYTYHTTKNNITT